MTPTDHDNDEDEDEDEHKDDDPDPVTEADVHRTHVRDDASVTESIVLELARLRDCSPTDLDPLYDDIDPEKLDWIVDEADENKVSFRTNGFAVTVYGDGNLVLTPAE